MMEFFAVVWLASSTLHFEIFEEGNAACDFRQKTKGQIFMAAGPSYYTWEFGKNGMPINISPSRFNMELGRKMNCKKREIWNIKRDDQGEEIRGLR